MHYAEAIDHVTVSVAPGGMMDMLLRREAARMGKTPVHRVQVSGMDAAARIVAAGLGPAVLPRDAVQGHASAALLALVPLADAWAERRFVIATRADGSVSASTRSLVQHLQCAAAAGTPDRSPSRAAPARVVAAEASRVPPSPREKSGRRRA
jgi:DNA-binding transcriptional LysR family regulator